MARFVTSDGVAIAYERTGLPSLRPPIVLQHGFVLDGRLNWVVPGVVAALVGTGREVLLLDARGHGGSEKPHDPARYGEDRMAQDVRELMDHLGAATFDLAGYSMGAIIALLVASRDHRVRRMVIGGVGEGLLDGAIQGRTAGGRAMAEALTTPDVGSIPPALQAFRTFAEAVGADRLALAAHARATQALPIALDAVIAPTLVLAGDKDPLAPHPERLAAVIPDATLEMLPGDHLGVLASPWFALAIAKWLNG